MSEFKNYPWKMWSDFFLLAGPREEAQAILNEEAVFAGRAVQEVGGGGVPVCESHPGQAGSCV